MADGYHHIRDADYSLFVQNRVKSLQERGVLCDVTIQVSDRSFPAHRCILAASSPYFEIMFNSSFVERDDDLVTIKGISLAAWKGIFSYIHYSQLIFTVQQTTG